MSIASEITRLQTAKSDLKTAIEAKGVTVSSEATLDAYPALVESIPSGGASSDVVFFYDYDGTLVESYTSDEIQVLSALPNAPDHSQDEVPLTFDEWNWTLNEIKYYNNKYPLEDIVVGANYHTTDDKTHFIIKITDGDLGGIKINLNTTSYIDYGDGNSETTSGLVTHVYQTAGTYDCSVDSITTFSFETGDSNQIFSRKIIGIYPSSKITSLGYRSFRNTGISKFPFNKQLTNVSDFNNNGYIGFVAFPHGTTSLNSLTNTGVTYSITVSIPPTITSFSSSTFQSNDFPHGILIPEGVTTIPSSGFYGTKVKSITIPSSVTSFSYTSTFQSSTVEYVNLLANIITIPESTFNSCNQLKSITLSDTITTIGQNAFSGCNSLININLSHITSIGNNAFYGCRLLKPVLYEGLLSIGSAAFQSCSSMINITIPSTVTSFGNSVFMYCRNLKNIIFSGNSITSMAGVWTYSGAEISFAEGVVDVPGFADSLLLQKVNYPSTTITIGESNRNSIQTVVIPQNVTSIGGFSYCYSLSSVTLYPVSPPALSSGFTSNLKKIYVPYSADHSVLEAYKAANIWSNYASIMEELPE